MATRSSSDCRHRVNTSRASGALAWNNGTGAVEVPVLPTIDANINDDPVRYIVELPEKSATTEEWLESIRREDAGRALVTSVAAAVDDEPTH